MEILEKLKQKYPEYSFEDSFYKNIRTNIKVKCKKHGFFHKKPSLMLYNNQGCQKCGLEKRSRVNKNNFIELIGRFNQIHNYKYDYSKSNYIKNNKNIVITCPIHGEFEQRPDNHLSGSGCRKCGLENMSNIKKYSKTDFIEKANQIHNYLYNYKKVEYIDSKTKVLIICKKHGEYEQYPVYHLSGSGCPKCFRSKGEKAISESLKKWNIKYIEQHIFNDCVYNKPLKFDFYLPEYNICIEYDGEQHFNVKEHWGGEIEFEKIKKRDKIKNEYCMNNNIGLIRISYLENIEEKLIKLKKMQ
jgi:hypothetical protein